MKRLSLVAALLVYCVFVSTSVSTQERNTNKLREGVPADWPSPETIGSCSLGQNVEVEASGGTTQAGYSTLKLAFDAVNAGTHTGTIAIEICGSTNETSAPAILNSSGAGSADYSALDIYPLADGLSVSGATAAGRGLIELNGADNVTINGDNPLTPGVNRNLTLQNTAANTTLHAHLIRIALNTTTVSTANNCTFRNLAILGNATGRNIAAATSTSGSENFSYGIFVGGNASGATTAPTAVGSSTPAQTGATASNLTIANNSIISAARAIVVNGSAPTVFPGLIVENNLVGNSTPASVDQVYSMGITVQGSTNAVVRSNTVFVESFVATPIRGIDFGFLSTAGSGALFEKNIVGRVLHNRPQTNGAYGINLGAGNNHVVKNNFVAEVKNTQASGTGGFNTTDGAIGIRIGLGTGHQVLHNSVHLTGMVPGTMAFNLTAAFLISGTGNTGLDVRNNIFSNQLTGGNPTGTRHAAICVPSNASTINLILNNNAYYQGSDPNSRLAQVGVSSFGTGEYLAADFDAGTTEPSSNFRAYSSTIGPEDNDDSSLGVAGVPPFSSSSDLHIIPEQASQLESAGADAGITHDIDGDPRGAAPDIGADEFVAVMPGTIEFSLAAYSGGESDGSISLSVTRTGGSDGAVSAQVTFADVSASGGAACSGNVDFDNDTIGVNFADGDTTPKVVNVPVCGDSTLESDETFTAELETFTGGATGGNPTSATVTIIDDDAPPPFSGSVSVGTGEAITSLTNAGGLFEQLNASGLSGNLTVDLTSDLTSETGAVALNQLVEFGGSGHTIFFQASGGPRLIEGSAAGSLIRLNGADRVTLSGGAFGPHGITIRNIGTGFTYLLQNDASNNSLSDCIVEGQGTVVVYIAPGPVTGSDNNSVTGNIIRDLSTAEGVPDTLILNFGLSESIRNSNNVIANNELFNFESTGIFSGHADNATITGNTIYQTADRTTPLIGINMSPQNLPTTTVSNNTIRDLYSTASVIGMRFADPRDNMVERNRIYNLGNPGGGTEDIIGILFEGLISESSITLVNNMISITGGANADQSIYGIVDSGMEGSTFNAFHNSVYIGGSTLNGTSPSWAILRDVDSATNHTSRNNIFYNDRFGDGNDFAAGDHSTNAGTLVSDNNLFAGVGPTATEFMDYGTSADGTPVTFAAWQAGPPARDASSLAFSASGLQVGDIFVDPANGDLHTKLMNPGIGAGAAGIASVDYDNDPRPASNPDMGADELVQAIGGVIPAGTYYNGVGTFGDTLGGNVEFTDTLYLDGVVFGGANTLTIGCDGQVVGQGPNAFVFGRVEKEFCSPGTFVFPVGTSPQPDSGVSPEGVTGTDYSPVTATVTNVNGPSSLAVTVFDETLGLFNPATSISRNWQLDETGDITVDLLFTYVDSDVNGNESDYRVFRRNPDGSFANFCLGASPCVDVDTNTAGPALNVTDFSRWTVAESLAVTAARATLGGRVLTSNRRGILGASIYLSGGDLASPRKVLTNPFGYYSFADLKTGQTYFLTVNSRRYTFSVPSRSVTLNDELTNFDFIADQ